MLMRPAASIARAMLILSLAVLAAAFVAAGLQYPILFWLAGGAAALRRFRPSPELWSSGTARLAWTIDLMKSGLLGSRGLIMGRVGGSDRPTLARRVRMLLDPRVPSELAVSLAVGGLYRSRWAAERMIRIRRFTHLMTIAPAGKGKSVSVLVPNLLSYDGSCVVCDPKLELWSLTFLHRRYRLRQRVYLLNPFGLYGARSDGFNPLDRRFIDPESPDFLSRAKDLANQLVVRSGEEREPHWNDSAELVLTAFICFVATEPDERLRNLTTVLKLISSRSAYLKAIEAMKQERRFGGVVAMNGRLLQWYIERELGSVITTTARHISWIGDPQVAACLSHTSFDPRLLRTGRVTVYLGLPHDKLVTLAGLMRTWLGCTLRNCTRGEPTEENPVLFLVDEAGHLGRMQALQDGITLMRGMGIRIWLFFQSLGQLHECYAKHASIILSNMDTCQFFALNDIDTAELVSRRIGEQTILVRTDNGGGGRSWTAHLPWEKSEPGNESSNWGWSEAPAGRAVLRPEELLVLPEEIAIVFHRNLPAIPTHLLKYYEAPEFREVRKGSRIRGTGAQRGLGPGAVLAAAVVMIASLVVAAGAMGGLPDPARLAGMAPGLPMRAGATDDAYGRLVIPPPPDVTPAPPPRRPVRGHGRRPAYRTAYPPVPAGAGPWGDGFSFWDPSTWCIGY